MKQSQDNEQEEPEISVVSRNLGAIH